MAVSGPAASGLASGLDGGLVVSAVLHVNEGEGRAVGGGAGGVGAGGLSTDEGVVGVDLEVVPFRFELERVRPEPRIRDFEVVAEVGDEFLVALDVVVLGRKRGGSLSLHNV